MEPFKIDRRRWLVGPKRLQGQGTSRMMTSFNEGVKHENMFQTTAAAVKMFHTDMIREKILYHVIHDENGKVVLKMVKTARLVQKSWLVTTTNLLRKSGQPVIDLTLTKDNSLNSEEEVRTKGKLLDRFVGRLTDASRMEQSFLPFKLTIELEYFRRENYESLIDCFTRLGSEMVELDMIYPIDGGAMPFFTFPVLRTLSFEFSNGVLQRQVKKTNFGDNESGFWLLQSLISGCKDLKKLNISFADDCQDLVPKSIEYLRLPDTVSCLKLMLKLKSKELEALVFQLTNLKHLKILSHRAKFEDGLMVKFLERFGKTLRKFYVVGPWSSGRPSPRTYLRFPLMEKLETVIVDSVECELGPGDLSSLKFNLPKLNRAEITYQTEAMLMKWLHNLNGENLESLAISVVDDRLKHEQDNFYKSVSLEIMTKVHTGFPNLLCFFVDLNISDLTVLKYLFEKMNYLKTLKINLQGKLKENGSVTKLDSILLGLPEEVVKALSFLETFVLKDDRQPCIRNLSELRNLTLWTEKSTVEGGPASLISDLVFSHGLLKMPQLRNLYFYGRFKPSPKMKKEWENQGRRLEYSAE